MTVHDRPLGYSAIQTANVLGNTVEFVTRADVDGKRVLATHDHRGVSLKVQECNFRAIAEFRPAPGLSLGLYEPTRWHVGFVQNLTAGGITYHYRNGLTVVTGATIAPEVVPCKDAGSDASWYDPNIALSRKQFGVVEEFDNMFPDDFPTPHPARRGVAMRYVEMGDGPGTGALPLSFACKGVDAANRAVLNQMYTIGWRDPLDTNATVALRAPLALISGSLSFKTWLALSSEPNRARLNQTTLFLYLYYWEWSISYATTIVGTTPTPTGSAIVTAQGLCAPAENSALVSGRDANGSVCVRFL